VFVSRQGLIIFLFASVSRRALGPTQPPIQRVSEALSLGIKRPGREADHSPPSSAEVQNAWRYTSTPLIRLHSVVLSYHHHHHHHMLGANIILHASHANKLNRSTRLLGCDTVSQPRRPLLESSTPRKHQISHKVNYIYSVIFS
jgi:hypothetical protein